MGILWTKKVANEHALITDDEDNFVPPTVPPNVPDNKSTYDTETTTYVF